eukprot:CAMPEP_0183717836 /NCGR_PEP_ID=MMETSP0737-20130205/11301_1 /TAXON_ID=385413 /ORGANISM="Thalassiosira miniscula, Strain CCMP1093" /LENGTH=962 /DNA_ID=CAMNT_0025947313 /DNA_START=125 /DNA_END=3013 /DNA_ORIENTATION=-
MTSATATRFLAATTAAALAILSPVVTAQDSAISSDGTTNDYNAGLDAAATSTTKKTSFRVFQTLPVEPTAMTPAELSQMHRTIRATQAMIFSPSQRHHAADANGGDTIKSLPEDDVELALDIYTPAERREYLVKRGNRCHPHVDGAGGGGSPLDPRDEDTSLQWYDVLSRYDSLMEASSSSHSSVQSEGNDAAKSNDSKATLATSPSELERVAIELFKFCVLYNGDGHAFLGWEEQLLLPFRDVVTIDGNYGVAATMDGMGKVDSAGVITLGDSKGSANDGKRYIHESFLSISPYAPATSELSAVIRLLLETPDDVLAFRPLLLPRELHRLIQEKEEGNNGGSNNSDESDGNDNDSASWTLLRNSCISLADTVGDGHSSNESGGADSLFVDPSPSSPLSDMHARRMSARCPLSEGGYCCLTFLPEKGSNGQERATRGNELVGDMKRLPVMALRHPAVGGWASGKAGTDIATDQMPYKLARAQSKDVTAKSSSTKPTKLGGVPESDLPYISTVRLVHNNTQNTPKSAPMTKFPSHPADSPNFFDILFENDCLPYRKECHRCLKDVANEAPPNVDDADDNADDDAATNVAAVTSTNACSKCQLECPCFCDILCKVRPPPKPVTRTYAVRPPAYRKEPHRLVPKIIHQTWFEPVTKDKYPNMSRLIESWKKSGWEYYFYDDDTAGDFLGMHFPPEIREAYESITPGAFKADLFRYCVLLIRGGVYADMDVLLETNLDDAVANDIGFMTPIDEPGVEVGHRSCLWNGLIASAPGHPFLAHTIEIVVNNIRNRFTAVDYDDMLCPNPILSVSHTVDTLFTCGPCILGAGINNLLGRHMQTEFEVGDVDLWQSERTQLKEAGNASKGSGGNIASNEKLGIRPDDQRLLIPGRTVILEQNKNDMGAHRFTWTDRHLIIAATDMPDYDDRPPTKEHYSKTHEKAGVYGMRKLYTDTKRANEEIRIVVEKL